MAKCVKLNMTVMSQMTGSDVTEDEFLDAFIDFIEKHNWMVCGHTCEEDDEE